jgi:hypothetical protein
MPPCRFRWHPPNPAEFRNADALASDTEIEAYAAPQQYVTAATRVVAIKIDSVRLDLEPGLADRDGIHRRGIPGVSDLSKP